MNVEDATTVGARAKEVRLERKLQQQEIADLLGLSLRGWQKIERDEGTPSGETLLLFEKLGINPGWVLSGLGPKKLDTQEAPSVTVDAKTLHEMHSTLERVAEATLGSSAQKSRFVEPRPPATVKYYPVYASAGFGATALYESPGEDLDIDGFFGRAFDVRAKHVNLFPIKGDSMLPTLAHGDIAIIDRRMTGDPEDGLVYLVSVNGDVYVKRTEWQEDGSLLLFSDNKLQEYAPIRVMRADLDKLAVVGQVIGVVHTL